MTTKQESPDSGASGCRCQNCGEVYYADLVVPDDVWAAISPDCNLLCASCIAERIVRVGIWTAIRGTDIDATARAGDQPIGYWIEGDTWEGDTTLIRRYPTKNYTVPLYTRAQDAAGKGVGLLIENLKMIGRIADHQGHHAKGALRNIGDVVTKTLVDYETAIAAKPAQVGQKDAIETAAKLRNAIYKLIPPNYPSSVNNSAEAGKRWEQKYVVDADHFRVKKEAAYAADELLHSLRGTEIEKRGIELARGAVVPAQDGGK